MAPSMAFWVVERESTRVALNGPTSFDLAQFELKTLKITQS